MTSALSARALGGCAAQVHAQHGWADRTRRPLATMAVASARFIVPSDDGSSGRAPTEGLGAGPVAPPHRPGHLQAHVDVGIGLEHARARVAELLGPLGPVVR